MDGSRENRTLANLRLSSRSNVAAMNIAADEDLQEVTIDPPTPPPLQVASLAIPRRSGPLEGLRVSAQFGCDSSHPVSLLSVPSPRSPRPTTSPRAEDDSGEKVCPTATDVSGGRPEPRVSIFSAASAGQSRDRVLLFPDSEGMKEKVRETLMKPGFNVADAYKVRGVWQLIARSPMFETLTLVVIALNAIWLAVDANENAAQVTFEGPVLHQVAENAFCVYFLLEWFIRFMAYEHKRDVFRDNWFIFDTILMVLMVIETWVLSIAIAVFGGSAGLRGSTTLRVVRLLRLTRMARMARLLRALPELMILIKGMCAAFRSVFLTLCLLILVMYIFAIMFTQLTQNTEAGVQYFGTVLNSMYTLLLSGTLLDSVGVVVRDIGRESHVIAGLFLVFVLLAALTIMNMLIGVLCEVVSVVAAVEKEELAVGFVKRKLADIIMNLDKDGNQQISKVEFEDILTNPEATRALREVDVDVMSLVELADFIFEDDRITTTGVDGDRNLDFSKFMEVVLQLRGTNLATMKDIVALRKLLRQGHNETSGLLEKNNMRLSRIEDRLHKVLGDSPPVEKPVHRVRIGSPGRKAPPATGGGGGLKILRKNSNTRGHAKETKGQSQWTLSRASTQPTLESKGSEEADNDDDSTKSSASSPQVESATRQSSEPASRRTPETKRWNNLLTRSRSWCTNKDSEQKDPPNKGVRRRLSVVVKSGRNNSREKGSLGSSHKTSLAARASQLESSLQKGLAELEKIMSELDSNLDDIEFEHLPSEASDISPRMSRIKSLPGLSRLFRAPANTDNQVRPMSPNPTKRQDVTGAGRERLRFRRSSRTSTGSDEANSKEELHTRMTRLSEAVSGGIVKWQRCSSPKRDSLQAPPPPVQNPRPSTPADAPATINSSSLIQRRQLGNKVPPVRCLNGPVQEEAHT